MELKPGMRNASRMFMTDEPEPPAAQQLPPEIRKATHSRSKSIGSHYSNDPDDVLSLADLFTVPEKPAISPSNFDQFLPWVCKCMSVEAAVHVIKLLQEDYVGVSEHKKKLRIRRRSLQNVRDLTRIKSSINNFNAITDGDILTLLAYYNNRDRLVAIHINDCSTVTQRFLKVLGLIIPYHPIMRKFKMVSGHLKKYVVYEMSKFLSISLVTDVCLDDTFTAEGNYYLLLDGENRINRLSLNRCTITDAVLELIAKRLENNEGFAKSLHCLELGSNCITDAGALMIANALRSNRKLLHLNLANNQITDVGADHILNTLKEFRLNELELKETVLRHIEFYKKKQKIFEKVLAEQKRRRAAAMANSATAVVPSYVSATPSASRRKGDFSSAKARKASRVSMIPMTKSPPTAEETAALITNQMTGGGKLRHEFDESNTVRRDDEVYCREVLEYQRKRDDKSEKFPGLLRIVIEGNYLPHPHELFETVEDLIARAIWIRMPLRAQESMKDFQHHHQQSHTSHTQFAVSK